MAAAAEAVPGRRRGHGRTQGSGRQRRLRDPHRVHPRLLPHRRPRHRRRPRRGRDQRLFGDALAGTGKPLVVASGLPAPRPGGPSPRRRAPENPALPRGVRTDRRVAAGRTGRAGRRSCASRFVGARRRRPLLHPRASSASPGPPACPPTSATAPTCGVGRPWRRRGPAVPARPGNRSRAPRTQPTAPDAAERGRGRGRALPRDRRGHRAAPERAREVDNRRRGAGDHFGGACAAVRRRSTSPACPARTPRQRFGWRPVEPGLIADLDQGHYLPFGMTRSGSGRRPAADGNPGHRIAQPPDTLRQ